MRRFARVMTVEANWSDPVGGLVDDENRRYSALAMLLRSKYLVDVDCWSEVAGRPLKPATIADALRRKLAS